MRSTIQKDHFQLIQNSPVEDGGDNFPATGASETGFTHVK